MHLKANFHCSPSSDLTPPPPIRYPYMTLEMLYRARKIIKQMRNGHRKSVSVHSGLNAMCQITDVCVRVCDSRELGTGRPKFYFRRGLLQSDSAHKVLLPLTCTLHLSITCLLDETVGSSAALSSDTVRVAMDPACCVTYWTGPPLRQQLCDWVHSLRQQLCDWVHSLR
jgi:hypothetical protein